MFRRRDHVPRRRIDDDYTLLRRGIEVDVIDADTRAADHLQRARRLDDLARHLRLAAHHQRVVAVHALAQLLRRQPCPHVHIRARALKRLNAVLGYRVTDEDAERGLSVPALPFSPSLCV